MCFDRSVSPLLSSIPEGSDYCKPSTMKMLMISCMLFNLLTFSQSHQSPRFEISCTMKDTQLAFHKEDHFAEHTVPEGADPEGAHRCHQICRDDSRCDAWTLNTNNGWCGLKTKNTVKVVSARGFVSGAKAGFGRFGTNFC